MSLTTCSTLLSSVLPLLPTAVPKLNNTLPHKSHTLPSHNQGLLGNRAHEALHAEPNSEQHNSRTVAEKRVKKLKDLEEPCGRPHNVFPL